LRPRYTTENEIGDDMLRAKLPTLDDLEELLSDDRDEDTVPQPNSLSPGDPLCAPVLVERQRRKRVDRAMLTRMQTLERISLKAVKFSRISAIGIGLMVVFASLEYLGILGHTNPPIWASAVLDGARYALGVNWMLVGLQLRNGVRIGVDLGPNIDGRTIALGVGAAVRKIGNVAAAQIRRASDQAASRMTASMAARKAKRDATKASG
jgi:hypothetical protein